MGMEQRHANHTASPAHNTDWRWNLGGPSTGGSSGGAYQRQRAAQPSATAATGSERGTEWRWNLGGSWQPPVNPSSISSGPAAGAPAESAGRSRPARNSSGDVSTTQRPWQRWRMLPEAIEQASTSEAARVAEGNTNRSTQQGWRRLIPRFLGQMLPNGQASREETRPDREEGAEAPAAAESRGVQADDADHHTEAAPGIENLSVVDPYHLNADARDQGEVGTGLHIGTIEL